MSKKSIAISLLVLFIIWAIASVAVNLPILPTPWKVLYIFISDLPDELGWHILVSLGRILASMILAATIGVPLGLALGQNRRCDKIFYP